MLKYVCISDLHAGALTSLLTDLPDRDPSVASPVTRAFAAAFGAFLSRTNRGGKDAPQLILLGDVFDLQFSDRAAAAASARTYLSALWETNGLSPDVIATAGNHDHALWTDARLALEANAFTVKSPSPEYRSATPAFSEEPGAQSRLLDAVLTSAGFGRVDLRYPNLGFHNAERAVFLHHGHFIETEYRLISALKDALSGMPRTSITAEDLAAENAGWIDFAWSSFGDAAGLGGDAERLYQNMLTSTGFRRLSRRWAEKLADALGGALPMSGNRKVRDVLGLLSEVGMDTTLGRFRDTERYAEVDALTPGGREGLAWYLGGPGRGQIDAELKELPQDLAFVFGHTHKPFEARLAAPGLPAPVRVYNTGGWTLNGPRLDNAEGAAMVLIDDDLNTASVRLFNTPRNGKVVPAHVEMLSNGSAGEQHFLEDIRDWLDGSEREWSNLAEIVCSAYERRQALLLKLTSDAPRRTLKAV